MGVQRQGVCLALACSPGCEALTAEDPAPHTHVTRLQPVEPHPPRGQIEPPGNFIRRYCVKLPLFAIIVAGPAEPDPSQAAAISASKFTTNWKGRDRRQSSQTPTKVLVWFPHHHFKPPLIRRSAFSPDASFGLLMWWTKTCAVTHA